MTNLAVERPAETKGTMRPAVIQLSIKEKAALLASYIPAFKNGGLFIPNSRAHAMGEEVYILLLLPETAERFPVIGRVAWITPAHTTKTQGIGVAFPGDEKSNTVKLRIEELLGTQLNSENPTQTF